MSVDPNEARRVVHEQLGPDEPIEAEGRAHFFFTDGTQSIWPEVHVVVTKERLLWAMSGAPDAGVPEMRFDRIVRSLVDGDAIFLTEQDPEYAATLSDPSNPQGEVDAAFQFGKAADERGLHEAIVAKLGPQEFGMPT